MCYNVLKNISENVPQLNDMDLNSLLCLSYTLKDEDIWQWKSSEPVDVW